MPWASKIPKSSWIHAENGFRCFSDVEEFEFRTFFYGLDKQRSTRRREGGREGEEKRHGFIKTIQSRMHCFILDDFEKNGCLRFIAERRKLFKLWIDHYFLLFIIFATPRFVCTSFCFQPFSPRSRALCADRWQKLAERNASNESIII